MTVRHMFTTSVLLGLFAVAGTGMLAVTHKLTEAPIAKAEREALLRNLHAIVEPSEHDNDIYADTVRVIAPHRLGSKHPVTVYRARKGGKPVAALIGTIAPDGYSGDIRLLVGVYTDGTLAGVRVIGHLETPGLGDDIEAERSDWILGFDARALDNPDRQGWHVKRDGGIFDQFTGATITPRAVVKAVYNTLDYFAANQQRLFDAPIDSTLQEDTPQ